MSDKTCKCCGKKHTFRPTLKERGMTWKEAKAIFIDSKGGLCASCYIRKRSQASVELMRKLTAVNNQIGLNYE